MNVAIRPLGVLPPQILRFAQDDRTLLSTAINKAAPILGDFQQAAKPGSFAKCNPGYSFTGIALEDDRWQPGAGWVVVEACGHESHGFDDAQAVCQAPAEQYTVA